MNGARGIRMQRGYFPHATGRSYLPVVLPFGYLTQSTWHIES